MRKSWFLLAIPFLVLVYGLVLQTMDVVSGRADERQMPKFAVQDVARRVCPDMATTTMRFLFDGGEQVGEPVTATDPQGDSVTYSQAASEESADYALFEVDPSTGALTVSGVGADDVTGLSSERLYTLKVVASDGRLHSDVGVVVQVVNRAAPAGDGVCP